MVWRRGGDEFHRTISTVAIHEGIVYAADLSGFLYALDVKTGALYWKHDMLAAVWASPLVADGKIYLGDEDGDVAVLAAGKTKKLISEMNMGSAVYATVLPQGRRALHPRPESPVRDQGRGPHRALEAAVWSNPRVHGPTAVPT